MRLNATQLRRIIKEETQRVLREMDEKAATEKEIVSVLDDNRQEILDHLMQNPEAIAALMNPAIKKQLANELGKAASKRGITKEADDQPFEPGLISLYGGPLMTALVPSSVSDQLYSKMGDASIIPTLIAGAIVAYLVDMTVHELSKSKGK
jgi:hypothetical protein